MPQLKQPHLHCYHLKKAAQMHSQEIVEPCVYTKGRQKLHAPCGYACRLYHTRLILGGEHATKTACNNLLCIYPTCKLWQVQPTYKLWYVQAAAATSVKHGVSCNMQCHEDKRRKRMQLKNHAASISTDSLESTYSIAKITARPQEREHCT